MGELGYHLLHHIHCIDVWGQGSIPCENGNITV